jgi:aspartate racemase
MHKVAGAITAAVSVPLLHIVDVTAQAIKAAGLTTVALLGTRFTMEESFYAARMAACGITLLVPPADDRRVVNDVIYDELVLGLVRDESRAGLLPA